MKVKFEKKSSEVKEREKMHQIKKKTYNTK